MKEKLEDVAFGFIMGFIISVVMMFGFVMVLGRETEKESNKNRLPPFIPSERMLSIRDAIEWHQNNFLHRHMTNDCNGCVKLNDEYVRIVIEEDKDE